MLIFLIVLFGFFAALLTAVAVQTAKNATSTEYPSDNIWAASITGIIAIGLAADAVAFATTSATVFFFAQLMLASAMFAHVRPLRSEVAASKKWARYGTMLFFICLGVISLFMAFAALYVQA